MSLRLSEQQLDMLRLMSVSGSSPMTVWVIGLDLILCTCGWSTGHSGLQGKIIHRWSWFSVREDLAAIWRLSSLHVWMVTSEKVFLISTIGFISLPYQYVMSSTLLSSLDNRNHYRFQSTFRFVPLPTIGRKKKSGIAWIKSCTWDPKGHLWLGLVWSLGLWLTACWTAFLLQSEGGPHWKHPHYKCWRLILDEEGARPLFIFQSAITLQSLRYAMCGIASCSA